jgi:hypothetical protein|tara:strand:+ start:1234 stop:2391 length:1158 start_codon:yes stop_codon:yes gene_type:complete
MNTIVAYPDNLSFSNGKYHHSSDNYKQTNTFSNLNEFDSLSQKDTLIYLVPSSIISSYVFENNQNLSKQNNLANFISDIDSFIVDDISKNEFFIFNENSFVINKTLYEELNTMLNTLNCKILVLPDYFLNRQFGKDTITEFNNKFLFSFKNGTGSSIEHDSLNQYIETVKINYPDFDPIIYCDSDVKDLKTFKIRKKFNISDFVKNKNDKEPNLFKFEVSIKNIFNKLNFTRMELYLCTFLIFCSLSLPYLFVSQNNKQISIYESETFNIFKAIDKNTNRVVTPKIQIDQLINQISLTPLAEIDNPISNFTNLNFLVSLGENYLKSVDIDFNSNEAVLSLEGLPEIQYRLIKNTVGSLNVEIISENVASNENLISGEIKIGFYNE